MKLRHGLWLAKMVLDEIKVLEPTRVMTKEEDW
jgi:hypothetical protein